MLSAEDNEILTRVGPGTPMGNLLLNDFRLHLRVLEHHPQTQPPPEFQAKRRSFAH